MQAADDTKLIRVRGPLINSSIDVNTYTVYIRPFYDEANNIGSLTLFSQPNTVYTLNGKGYVGTAGLQALSVLSAGTTIDGRVHDVSNGLQRVERRVRRQIQFGLCRGRKHSRGCVHGGRQRRRDRPKRQYGDLAGFDLFLNTADEFFFVGRRH